MEQFCCHEQKYIMQFTGDVGVPGGSCGTDQYVLEKELTMM